ncbi:MAG: hypothetical protein KGI45_02500 [Patescibacteria group bacterium]|nr:hypothetical protein [Patescibacteria group bacterium]MDE1940966.1 hypothetical protein [Patescibacteria group bacterium]MDE1966922.1 hypothetical protein [Patescibacteria group bacterium]
MKTIEIYLGILLPLVSIPLALFEIWLEENRKTGPWGKTYFKDAWWGKKFCGNNPISRFLIRTVSGHDYIERYHIVMFFIVIPAWFAAIYFAFWFCSNQTGWSLTIFPIFGTKTFAPLFFLAIGVGNMVAEDFLYFAIQSVTGRLFGWGKADALWRFLHGDHAWTTDWLPKVCGYTIPRSYLIGSAVVAIMLFIEHGLANRF